MLSINYVLALSNLIAFVLVLVAVAVLHVRVRGRFTLLAVVGAFLSLAGALIQSFSPASTKSYIYNHGVVVGAEGSMSNVWHLGSIIFHCGLLLASVGLLLYAVGLRNVRA